MQFSFIRISILLWQAIQGRAEAIAGARQSKFQANSREAGSISNLEILNIMTGRRVTHDRAAIEAQEPFVRFRPRGLNHATPRRAQNRRFPKCMSAVTGRASDETGRPET